VFLFLHDDTGVRPIHSELFLIKDMGWLNNSSDAAPYRMTPFAFSSCADVLVNPQGIGKNTLALMEQTL